MQLCVCTLQATSSNADSTATHADNLGESQPEPEPELRRAPVIDIEPFDETPFSVSNVYFRIECSTANLA